MMRSAASTQCEVVIGFVPPAMSGIWDSHMNNMRSVPLTAAIFSPAPSSMASPMPSSPAMNRTSPKGLRKIEKNPAKGPSMPPM